ncbi:MAG: TraB/GumN family protein [Gammaproteobacteria bacterium]|nr:MAG: TraB/GumN family protein [Gammaproteobacteria bacterium]
MPEHTEIEPNVDLIEYQGRSFYIIGTAHVSKDSAELVEKTIRERSPDTVAIELCEARFESLSNPEAWKETDIYSVIKSGRAYVLMTQLALSTFQKKLADEFGVRPGEEMHRAIKVSKETGAELSLVDREIRITLKRAWAKAGFWTLMKVLYQTILSVFNAQEISEEDIEKMKSGDELAMVMEEFSGSLPGVKVALIDERDQYLAAKILRSPGDTVVAVVGAAHVPGIKRAFGAAIDLAVLEKIPPPKKIFKVIGWAIPLLLLGLITTGFILSGRETTEQMIIAWILANGIAASLGTILALAHPLTILTAFVAAPITSLNPTIAAGWVCGLVEAYLRKPRVRDLEQIADDMTSIRGLWSNRVIKVLLVVVLANLGSSVGTFIGVGWIVSLLGGGGS